MNVDNATQFVSASPPPPNYRRNEKRDIDKLPSNQTQPEGLKIRELIVLNFSIR